MSSQEEQSHFKILIVDDHEHNVFALRTLIRKHLPKADVIEALSGMQALDLALKRSKEIDLIILDVQMPEMDGFQTASMLKIRNKTKDIPIIFLTAAFKTSEFQQRGYEVGAVDYLLKPIDDNQLINKISTYIRLIENERSLNRELERRVRERTAELAQAKQNLENIIAFMGEALLVLNPEGIVTSANPAACRMLGYSPESLVGLSIGDVFEEEDQEKAKAFMGIWLEALVRSGVIANIEASFISKSGRRVPVLFSRSAMYDQDGIISGIICIAKDMSEYKRMVAVLREGEESSAAS
jgi:PAS domain S-box-containing protein